MYTGELFYETRENIEHLAMIEKQCGPFPEWMARQTSSSSMRNIFLTDNNLKQVDGYPMRIDWPEAQQKQSSYGNWKKMKLLSTIV